MLTNTIKYKKSSEIYAYCPGTFICSEGMVFTAFFNVKSSFKLNLYDKKGTKISEADMLNYRISGNVFSVCVSGINHGDIIYDYELDGKIITDPFERSHQVIRKYGEHTESDGVFEKSVLAGFDYNWEDDEFPSISFNDVIGYSLHVRGFTEHPSSKVKGRGTFLGVTEKIQYLCDLGINQIELMPAYEFYEFNSEKEKLTEGHPKYSTESYINENGEIVANEDKLTLNYWGFKKGNYFCPKAGYSYSKDFVNEFKDMVKALHKAGIEVVMQFFFEACESSNVIISALRFWRSEYHIDGFHVMGENIPKVLISTDDYLCDAKLYFDYISEDEMGALHTKMNKNIADVSRSFMTDARRYLKSDDGALHSFVSAQRYNPTNIHKINYLTCYEGFTLNDLVSYDYKHNEDNGEDNRDGSDYNYSWNCGVEGVSRKKAITSLRMRQMKNALCLLILSQATPMLFMGDELMNTQKGNNNPYCQDNEISWLNWNINKTNAELLSFTKELIKFRKQHLGIHAKEELKLMDYKSCGFPDISYHQDMAWKSRLDTFMKHIGVLLYGKYFDDDSIYILYNMHWENHLFGIPKLPEISGWKCILSTESEMTVEEIDEELSENPESICVYGRSVMILKSICNKNQEAKKK